MTGNADQDKEMLINYNVWDENTQTAAFECPPSCGETESVDENAVDNVLFFSAPQDDTAQDLANIEGFKRAYKSIQNLDYKTFMRGLSPNSSV